MAKNSTNVTDDALNRQRNFLAAAIADARAALREMFRSDARLTGTLVVAICAMVAAGQLAKAEVAGWYKLAGREKSSMLRTVFVDILGYRLKPQEDKDAVPSVDIAAKDRIKVTNYLDRVMPLVSRIVAEGHANAITVDDKGIISIPGTMVGSDRPAIRLDGSKVTNRDGSPVKDAPEAAIKAVGYAKPARTPRTPAATPETKAQTDVAAKAKADVKLTLSDAAKALNTPATLANVARGLATALREVQPNAKLDATVAHELLRVAYAIQQRLGSDIFAKGIAEEAALNAPAKPAENKPEDAPAATTPRSRKGKAKAA